MDTGERMDGAAFGRLSWYLTGGTHDTWKDTGRASGTLTRNDYLCHPAAVAGVMVDLLIKENRQ